MRESLDARLRTRKLCALAGLAALLVADRALADPCRTITSRPASAIVPPLTNQATVTILPGERLCLDPSNGFRIAAPGADGVVDVSLTTPGSRSVLRLRNPLSSPVEYQVSASIDGGWRPYEVARVQPNRVQLSSWAKPVGAVSLTGFRRKPTSPSTSPPAVAAWDEPMGAPLPPFLRAGKPRPWLAISLLQRISRPNLSPLDAELARHGYGHVSRSLPSWGMAFDGARNRFRIGLDWEFAGAGSYHRIEDRERFNISRFSVGLHVGYSIIRYGLLSVYPAVGVEGGLVSLNVDPDRHPFLDGQLGVQRDLDSVKFSYGAVVGTVGIDSVVPMWRASTADYGLLIGVRGGYAQQFTRGGWGKGEEDLPALERSGPEATTSGAVVRFSIGIAECSL